MKLGSAVDVSSELKLRRRCGCFSHFLRATNDVVAAHIHSLIDANVNMGYTNII